MLLEEAPTIGPTLIDQQGDSTEMVGTTHLDHLHRLAKTCHKHHSHRDQTHQHHPTYQCLMQRMCHSNNRSSSEYIQMPALQPRQPQPSSAMQPIFLNWWAQSAGGEVSKPPIRPTVVVPPPKQKRPSLPPVPEDDDDETQEAGTSNKKRKKNKDCPQGHQYQHHPPMILHHVASLGPSASPFHLHNHQGLTIRYNHMILKNEEFLKEVVEDEEAQRTRRYMDEDSDLALMKLFEHSSPMSWTCVEYRGFVNLAGI